MEPPPVRGLDDGDVLLCARRCAALGVGWPRVVCESSKRLANSRWDHVGVVVLVGGEPHVLEVLPEAGARLTPLAERLSEAARIGAETVAVRRLHVQRTAEMRAALRAHAEAVAGRPHTRDPRALLSANVRSKLQLRCERLQREWTDTAAAMRARRRRGDAAGARALEAKAAQLERKLRRTERKLEREGGWFDSAAASGDGLFAAQLVAAAYQRMGLLPEYPSAGSFRPKDFSAERRGANAVELLQSALLGREHELVVCPELSDPVGAEEDDEEEDDEDDDDDDDDDDDEEDQDLVAHALRRTYPFTRLPRDLQTALERQFRREVVPRGFVACEQGEPGTGVFVVESGKVDALKTAGDGDGDAPELVSSLGRGAVVGARSLESGAPRSATVVCAARECALWRLSREAYAAALQARGVPLRPGPGQELPPQWLRDQLRGHFLFQHAPLTEFFRVEVGAGEAVFEQGGPGESLFAVESGELARLVRHPWQAAAVRVDTLRAGRTFGELSLMFDCARGSTVRAQTPAVLWALSRESFERLHLFQSHEQGRLRRVFERFASEERDGVAYMTGNDLLRALRVTSSQPLLLKLLDSNSSGRIDFHEFVRFQLLAARPEAAAELTFMLLDDDRDGRLSADEFRRGAALLLGETPSPEAVAALFGPDEAGELDFFAWRAFAAEHPALLAPVRGAVARSRASWRAAGGDADVLPSEAAGPLAHVLASLAAVAASRTAVAPLDRLKLLQQLGARPGGGGLPAGLLALARRRGARGLWRSHGTNLVRLLPFSAVTLLLSEGAAAARIGSGEDGELTPLELVAAGGAGGVAATLATYPLDVARAHLAAASPGAGATTRSALRHARAAGLLYAGLAPTLAGVFAYAGLSFGIREAVLPMLPRENDGSMRVSPAWALVCGVLSARVSQLMAYPFDTVRRVQQVHGGSAREAYSRVVGGGGGRRALFRGVVPNLAKIVPSAVLTMGVYEGVLGLLRGAPDR